VVDLGPSPLHLGFGISRSEFWLIIYTLFSVKYVVFRFPLKTRLGLAPEVSGTSESESSF